MFAKAKMGRKVLTFAGSVALAVGSLVPFSAPAQAADPVGSLRIVASDPAIDTSVNGWNNQAAMDGFMGNGWYPTGSTYKQTYLDTGSTFSFTYEARNTANELLTDTTVNVLINKSYSASTAELVCNGTNVNAAGSPGDGLVLSLVTNNLGRVTVTCVNGNEPSDEGVIARPESLVASAEIHSLHTQIWAEIPGQALSGDMMDYQFIQPADYQSEPRTATATVLTFESDETSGALPYDNFGGTLTTERVAAPAGGNGTNALKVHYDQGAAFYAGMFLINTAAGTEKLTKDGASTITMNIYSASAGDLLIRGKLERAGLALVPVADVTVKQGWNHVTFNFGAHANWSASEEYHKLSMFFGFVDGSTDGKAAAADFYLDDVAFNGGTTPALPAKPAATRAASVAGVAKVGKVLTAGKGTWTGTATITYAYKWFRCTKAASAAGSAAPAAAAKCTAISGATKATYKLVAKDKGKFVRVMVTARNSVGSKISLSKSTAAIK